MVAKFPQKQNKNVQKFNQQRRFEKYYDFHDTFQDIVFKMSAPVLVSSYRR